MTSTEYMYYRLNEDGTTTGMENLDRWPSNEERRVDRTDLPDGVWVSTVFLVLDHGYGGDPLLYIESIPYWETRGYVTMVLRNYWMYEGQTGKAKSPSRAALAQGMWPRFPGLPGASAVRLQRPNVAQASVAPKTTIALNATVSPQSNTALPQAN